MSIEGICELCGEPLPPGEEMFNYHGYSCDCPKPPLKKKTNEFTGDIDSWLSAALEDPAVAPEMKEAINLHFERVKALNALLWECKDKAETSQAHQATYLWFVESLNNAMNIVSTPIPEGMI